MTQLATMFRFGVVGNLSDSQLVQTFLSGSDGSDQAAFSALVERHGPMVLSVCRQVLGNTHDSQDAFQATFLVLARKAGSVHNAESLAAWLHGVALRIAARAKADEARRRVRERRCAMLKQKERASEAFRSNPYPELHEEIARLPQRYREPVVLCYMEGLTSEEAAARIGCPPGTVWSRLSRARTRLRGNLLRRGVALPAALVVAGFMPSASAAVPARLLDATVRASLGFAGRRAAESALASAPAIMLARRVLYAMTISKLKFLGVAGLACALALGGAQTLTLGQSGGLARTQDPAVALPGDDDDHTALSRSVDRIESKMDETDRRNGEVRNELQDIRARLKGLRAAQVPAAAKGAVVQLAEVIKNDTASAVTRFADVLKRHPPRRSSLDGERMQLYILDLVQGGTTLIADEPAPGLALCGGPPKWSHDGSRIIFTATPGNQVQLARVMALEIREGRPTYLDLGPGNLPTLSGDDKRIAFLLNPGAELGAEAGIWVMQADGSQRRRLGEFGAPFWSPDGREFMILGLDDFPQTIVMNFEKVTEGKVEVPGYRIFSWPSWAGPGTLVAALSTGKDGNRSEGDMVALLDVSNPDEAKIIEILWQRGDELDVTPRWPVYWPGTRRCYFLGVEGNKRELYFLDRGKSRRATKVEVKGHNNRLGGLAFSPDGRYLLMGDNRP